MDFDRLLEIVGDEPVFETGMLYLVDSASTPARARSLAREYLQARLQLVGALKRFRIGGN